MYFLPLSHAGMDDSRTTYYTNPQTVALSHSGDSFRVCRVYTNRIQIDCDG